MSVINVSEKHIKSRPLKEHSGGGGAFPFSVCEAFALAVYVDVSNSTGAS